MSLSGLQKQEPAVIAQAAMIEKLGTKGAALGEEAMIAALNAQLKQVETWMGTQEFITTSPVQYHNLL